MPTRRLALALALVLLLGGCSLGLCGRNSDCAAGEVCTTVGQCVVPPADAGADGTTDGSGDTVIDRTGEDPRPAGRAVGVPTPRDSASPIENEGTPGGNLEQGAQDGR